jgi:hypothetical protein
LGSSYQEGRVGIQLSRGEGWDPIKRFNTATFWNLDFQRHMSLSFFCSVTSVKMRGDCLFCWYWWNFLPSLFKLAFHNVCFCFKFVTIYFFLFSGKWLRLLNWLIGV